MEYRSGILNMVVNELSRCHAKEEVYQFVGLDASCGLATNIGYSGGSDYSCFQVRESQTPRIRGSSERAPTKSILCVVF